MASRPTNRPTSIVIPKATTLITGNRKDGDDGAADAVVVVMTLNWQMVIKVIIMISIIMMTVASSLAMMIHLDGDNCCDNDDAKSVASVRVYPCQCIAP